MIYLFALNPAVDYHMDLGLISFGETNRSNKESFVIGGKGINVAMVLETLATPSTLLGFQGGFTGSFIKEELAKHPAIFDSLIAIDGNSRINVKLKQDLETEINAVGPLVSNSDIHALESKLNNLNGDDIVVMNGSLAHGMNPDWYLDQAKLLSAKGIPFILDIATPKMLDICQYKPILVKPNRDELEMIFETEIHDEVELISYGKKLLNKGAQHVLISLGADGSLLLHEDKVLKALNPPGQVVGTVGAGDSMIAGFIYEFLQHRGLVEILKTAVAAGSGTAYSEFLVDHKMITQLRNQITITESEV